MRSSSAATSSAARARDETLALIRSLDATCCAATARTARTGNGRARGGISTGSACRSTVELDGVLYCHATPADEHCRSRRRSRPTTRCAQMFAGDTRHVRDRAHAPPVRPARRRAARRQRRLGRHGVRGRRRGVTGRSSSTASRRPKRTPFDVERAVARDRARAAGRTREEFVAENLLHAVAATRRSRRFESRR